MTYHRAPSPYRSNAPRRAAGHLARCAPCAGRGWFRCCPTFHVVPRCETCPFGCPYCGGTGYRQLTLAERLGRALGVALFPLLVKWAWWSERRQTRPQGGPRLCPA